MFHAAIWYCGNYEPQAMNLAYHAINSYHVCGKNTYHNLLS